MDKQPNSRSCFMCGRENDSGLKMSWYNIPEKEQNQGKVTIPERFNGYPGIAHGGIVAAILDETAGRSILLDGDFDELFVTLKLETTFRNLTPTGVELTAVGWVIRRSAHKAKVAAELRLPDGTVTATCEALVVRPPKEVADRWGPEKKFWKVDSDRL
ncbi:MAG: PaaI family thioesterase [Gammaproteobacteria bacterium]|nr:PaaI family thioesterase [Gammaproteobacteria bacterium]